MAIRFSILLAALLLPAAASGADEGAVRDFKAVEAAMKSRPATYTGNPDVDFRKHLIASRQAIIGMAEVTISHTADPETEALARKVIANQKRDIAEMDAWLKKEKAAN